MNKLNWFLTAATIFAGLVFSSTVILALPECNPNLRSGYNSLVPSVLVPPLTLYQTGNARESKPSVVPPLQFFGDILLGRNVERLMQKNGVQYPFKHFADFINPRSSVFANFEASVPSVHIPTPDMVTRFSVNPIYVSVLQSMGITHVTLANNHSFDYGQAGLTNTEHTLMSTGIVPFGNPNRVSSSSVTYVLMGDYRVAVIALNAVFFDPNQDDLSEVIADSEKQSNIQIAYVHWGTEYDTVHSKKQTTFAQKLVALGVDAIIGHHPHVVQDIQLIDNVPVFYSLGNFIFDQYFSNDVQTELSLTMSYADDTLTFTLIPLSSLEHRSQPTMVTGTALSDFYTQLANHSDATQQENIKQGKVIVPFLLATSSKTSIISE